MTDGAVDTLAAIPECTVTLTVWHWLSLAICTIQDFHVILNNLFFIFMGDYLILV